jgi:hypothetical protein
VSIYPQIFVAALKPRVAYTSPKILYDGDPNIELGTVEPTTPTLEIPITLPPITGDKVFKARYYVVIATNPINPSSDAQAYIKVRIGSKERSVLCDLALGYYKTAVLTFHDIDVTSTIQVFAWSTVAGTFLRKTVVVLCAVPIISSRVVNMLAVRTRAIAFPSTTSYNAITACGIRLCNADVPEVTLTGEGAGIIRNNVIMPSLEAEEKTTVDTGSTELRQTLYVLYPSIIAWAEYE